MKIFNILFIPLFITIVLLILLSCSEREGSPGGYVVTLNLSGGIFPDGRSGGVYGGAYTPTPLKDILERDVHADPSAPAALGEKIFAVWNTVPDGSGEDYIGDTIVDRDITLYAIYGEAVRTRDDLFALRCGDENAIYALHVEDNSNAISMLIGSPWVPLCSIGVPFKGRLYGKGFAIVDLATKVSNTDAPDYGGLFAHTDGARIADIIFSNARIGGKRAAGAVAGRAVNSVITRIDVTGELTSTGYAGGVAGEITGGTVISQSFFNRTVVGVSDQIVRATGTASAAGGIVGHISDASVKDCAVYSNITSDLGLAGGIAGLSENGEITGAIHTGTVSADVSGGIVGESVNSTVKYAWTDSIITGNVTGGIAGIADNSEISSCAAFKLYINGSESGKIAGRVTQSSVEDCYSRYDALLNLRTTGDGGNNGTGEDILRMRKEKSFFEGRLGFNFFRDWKLPAYYEYPRLRWENTPAFTEVWSASDLARVRRNLDGYYVLKHDIDLMSYDEDGYPVLWQIIGTSDSPFTGKFDGNGFTISNIYSQRDWYELTAYGWLFGNMSGANIYDLKIVNGILADSAGDSVIERVNVKTESGTLHGRVVRGGAAIIAHASFDGLAASGGIATYSSGLVLYSHTSGRVDNTSAEGALIGGGLIGSASGVVYACYSSSDVNITGFTASTAGGLTGSVTGGEVIDSYSTGSVRSAIKDYISTTDNITPVAGGLSGWIVNARINGSVSFAESVGGYLENVRVLESETIAARITAASDNTTYTDVYAYGGMLLTADNQTGVMGVTVNEKIPPESFYIGLGWDFERVWRMGANGYPEHKKR
jgi:hypothetical protein